MTRSILIIGEGDYLEAAYAAFQQSDETLQLAKMHYTFGADDAALLAALGRFPSKQFSVFLAIGPKHLNVSRALMFKLFKKAGYRLGKLC